MEANCHMSCSSEHGYTHIKVHLERNQCSAIKLSVIKKVSLSYADIRNLFHKIKNLYHNV